MRLIEKGFINSYIVFLIAHTGNFTPFIKLFATTSISTTNNNNNKNTKKFLFANIYFDPICSLLFKNYTIVVIYASISVIIIYVCMHKRDL